MTKLILILAFVTSLWADKYPKDITGKWAVDNVELGDAANKIPQQQRDMALMMATQVFATATLEFKADHTVVITADMPNIPKGGKWDYDAKTGAVTITGPPNQQGKNNTMQLLATERAGKTVFSFPKMAGIELTVVRKK